MWGIEDGLRWLRDEAHWLIHARGLPYGWNLLLAFVPLVCAFALFRPGVRRTVGWWTGVVAFGLFLPNAAYVLTDVVHLLDDVRYVRSDLILVTLFLPAYALFFAIGFGCYVASLSIIRAYLAVEAPSAPWLPVECGIHGLAAVGIYLGRVVRLNSWEVATAPHDVLDSLAGMAGGFPVFFVVFTSAVLLVATTLTRPVLHAAAGLVVRVVRHLDRHGASVGRTAVPG